MGWNSSGQRVFTLFGTLYHESRGHTWRNPRRDVFSWTFVLVFSFLVLSRLFWCISKLMFDMAMLLLVFSCLLAPSGRLRPSLLCLKSAQNYGSRLVCEKVVRSSTVRSQMCSSLLIFSARLSRVCAHYGLFADLGSWSELTWAVAQMSLWKAVGPGRSQHGATRTRQCKKRTQRSHLKFPTRHGFSIIVVFARLMLLRSLRHQRLDWLNRLHIHESRS